jgi:lipoprotein-anchoring transpeptidase ErfK/SrfK
MKLGIAMYERISITDKRSKVKSQNRLPKIQRKKDYSRTKNSSVDRIHFLQRTAGNQAVQRLIKSGALQAKLRIGQPGDKYEQEADRVAEQVMRMPESQALSGGTPYIQRMSLGCEDEVLSRQPIEEEDELRRQPIEEDEEELQAKATSDGISEVNPDIESHIQNMRGGGEPLPESARAYFEPRFGQDFSQVRVHSDAKAVESARAVNARGFTVGKDVVFGKGEYAPETVQGRKLLAHELTHVVQQKTNENIIQAHLYQVPVSVPPPWIERININLTNQNLNIRWSNQRTSRSYDICSGKGCPNTGRNPCSNPNIEDSYCTPTGTFYNLQLGGETHINRSGDNMCWYVQFSGRGIGIHNCQPVVTNPSSHGCVRVIESVARLIHNNVARSTSIVVSGNAPTRSWSLSCSQVSRRGYRGCPCPPSNPARSP